MKLLLKIFLLCCIIACNKKESAPCQQEIIGARSGKMCVDGEIKCNPHLMEVPGMPQTYDCIPKGLFNFVCNNPCPPYTKLLLTTKGELLIKKDPNGLDVIEVGIRTDLDHLGQANWGPTHGEQFWINPLPENKGFRLNDWSGSVYRIWDPVKVKFSKTLVEGSMNMAKDTMFLTYYWGWDEEQDYKENRCDLIFVKTDAFQ